MARQFRFTDRWRTSLRGVHPEDTTTTLDQRDLELEGFMDNAFPVAYRAALAANQNTTAVAVSAVTQTVQMRRHDQALVIGTFDADTGTGTFIGSLYVNGVAQVGSANLFGGTRSTISQTWLYTATADGKVTFNLRIQHSGGVAWLVRQDHTAIAVLHLR